MSPTRRSQPETSNDVLTNGARHVRPRAAVRKPVILVLVGYYLPGYKAGGPIRSISNMVEALGGDFDFRILSSDHDHKERTPYQGIKPHEWVTVGKAQVQYVPSTMRKLWSFIKVVRSTPADAVYLNSFFSRRFSMLPLALRRMSWFHVNSVVLAPRGEFSLSALRLKGWRKRIYIAISKWLGLHRDVLWHASSPHEERDICRIFGPRARIAVASPIPAGRNADKRDDCRPCTMADRTIAPRTKPAGSIRLLFLSRIARMKNLDGAIALLGGLSGRVYCGIYGPVEDRTYWESCQNMLSRLPANIHVEYRGEVAHEAVPDVLSQHDVLLFPSHGENYGHVILEALVAGCPVVISDRTPWRDLEGKGVGWDLPLQNPERFQRVLQECIDMLPEKFLEWSHRARRFGLEKVNDTEILEQNRNLFAAALKGAH